MITTHIVYQSTVSNIRPEKNGIMLISKLKGMSGIHFITDRVQPNSVKFMSKTQYILKQSIEKVHPKYIQYDYIVS